MTPRGPTVTGHRHAAVSAWQACATPPGAVAEAHSHDGYETAIYQLSGRVETRDGPGLAESVGYTKGVLRMM